MCTILQQHLNNQIQTNLNQSSSPSVAASRSRTTTTKQCHSPHPTGQGNTKKGLTTKTTHKFKIHPSCYPPINGNQPNIPPQRYETINGLRKPIEPYDRSNIWLPTHFHIPPLDDDQSDLGPDIHEFLSFYSQNDSMDRAATESYFGGDRSTTIPSRQYMGHEHHRKGGARSSRSRYRTKRVNAYVQDLMCRRAQSSASTTRRRLFSSRNSSRMTGGSRSKKRCKSTPPTKNDTTFETNAEHENKVSADYLDDVKNNTDDASVVEIITQRRNHKYRGRRTHVNGSKKRNRSEPGQFLAPPPSMFSRTSESLMASSSSDDLSSSTSSLSSSNSTKNNSLNDNNSRSRSGSDPDIRMEQALKSTASGGMGHIFLTEMQNERRHVREMKHHLDPRSAARTPAARREPVYRLRFDCAINASPSRIAHESRSVYLPTLNTISSIAGVSQNNENDCSVRMGTTTSSGGINDSSILIPKHSNSRDEDNRMFSTSTPCKSASINIDHLISSHDDGVENCSATLKEGNNGVMESSGQQQVQKYPLHLLQITNYRLPVDVNRAHLERHLTHHEFFETFGMRLDEFQDLPYWKRCELKKRVNIF